MKDYTLTIDFWKRLESFVSDTQTNCCMGEEEKQMILHNCKFKISEQLPKNNCTLNRQTCGKGSGCKYPHCHI